uniref:Uncharacterized protein n=1 Tax=Anguilla anguilla TaxID=7936 RepID=A0A0E9VCB1_ANGAN
MVSVKFTQTDATLKKVSAMEKYITKSRSSLLRCSVT